jgi:hypothetical protein
MWVPPRKETRSRGYTNRRLHKEVREIGALGRQSIKIRRLDPFVTVHAKAIPAVLIGHDE